MKGTPTRAAEGNGEEGAPKVLLVMLVFLMFASGFIVAFAANIYVTFTYQGQGSVGIQSPTFSWGQGSVSTISPTLSWGQGSVSQVSPMVTISASGSVSVTLLTQVFDPVVAAVGLNHGIFIGPIVGGSVSWTQLPGLTNNSVSLARCGEIVYVAVRGLNGGIFVGYYNQTSGSFTGWVNIPGATPSSPAIAADASCNLIYVVVRGMNNAVFYTTISPSLAWSGFWQTLPGATDNAPSAAVLNGALHVAVKGFGSNAIWLWNSTTATWTMLPGATNSTPAIASNGTHLLVAVRGLNNAIYYGFMSDNAFTGWTPIPGATDVAPAVANVSGTWYMAVKGSGSLAIFFRDIPGTSWQNLPGATMWSLAVG
ncbi:MAG: hypothetical protein F7C07_08440 [Desulfurococcales archaeon]|nr:hypothetical protein [Desulfurococcales archaeon]